MKIFGGLVHAIDWINRWVGSSIRWLALGMVIATTYEVISRYLFNAPTVWAHQTVIIMGGMLVPLSWGWVELRHAHVRMDILYRRLTIRRQALLDVICSLLFFFPLIGLLIYVSVQWAANSWVMGERWTISIWKPLLAPSRTAIMVGFTLFFMQGLATFVRNVYVVLKGETL